MIFPLLVLGSFSEKRIGERGEPMVQEQLQDAGIRFDEPAHVRFRLGAPERIEVEVRAARRGSHRLRQVECPENEAANLQDTAGAHQDIRPSEVRVGQDLGRHADRVSEVEQPERRQKARESRGIAAAEDGGKPR